MVIEEEKKEARHFWITQDIFDEVKKIQLEYKDERPAHTVRRLIREALAARAEKKESSHG